jgi:hypothetical protein
MSAVTQTDPPRVEIEGFKLTHLEQGQRAVNFPEDPEDMQFIWPIKSRCKNRKREHLIVTFTTFAGGSLGFRPVLVSVDYPKSP